MSLQEDLTADVGAIFRDAWTTRNGEKVPEDDDIQLGNDGVVLDATVLYADLAESTKLVQGFKREFAAEVYKSYLLCASRVIRANDGVITAFDGDRVMAVYIGKSKNTSAAMTALQINYLVTKLINPKLKEVYKNSDYAVRQSVGVDSGELLVAKTGIRGSNDLVWVGQAANLAAKMCALRENYYSSYISARVFDVMNKSAKYGGQNNELMWDNYYWQEQNMNIHRSSWWSRPD